MGCAVVLTAIAIAPLKAGQAEKPSLADAQRLFYNARYDEDAALSQSLRASGPQDLANDEVRTTDHSRCREFAFHGADRLSIV